MKIALLGAESTGKTTLAHALAAHLQTQRGRAVAVDEYLREWCDAHQRVPQAHEQWHIAQEQRKRIDMAQSAAKDVVADSTPLSIAIYSEYFFDDLTLYPTALDYQRSFDVTLVTGLDVAWQADGYQRDGPQVRDDLDGLLRKVLGTHQIAYCVVYGQGNLRLENALLAIQSSTQSAIDSVAARAVSTLATDQKPSKNWVWACDKCSDPDCEHKLFSSLQKNVNY